MFMEILKLFCNNFLLHHIYQEKKIAIRKILWTNKNKREINVCIQETRLIKLSVP